jgi:hypothetical protein
MWTAAVDDQGTGEQGVSRWRDLSRYRRLHRQPVRDLPDPGSGDDEAG